MLRYRFEAVTYSGKTERGIVEGEDVHAVRQMLLAKQLVPISVDLDTAWSRRGVWSRWFSDTKPLSRNELTILTKQLAILVRSGIQIDSALAVLSDETNQKHVKRILNDVASELRSGLSFSKAITSQSDSFDALYQGIISAAEYSGNMGLVLGQLAEFLEKRQALKQKALGALAYPAMLTGVAMMIVLFLMVYVVPQISRVFESSKQQLPFSTRFILGLSDLLLSWGWLILILTIGLSYFVHHALKKPGLRLRLDRLLLSLPVLGPLLLGFETARFAGTLAMLSSANVPLLSALQSAKSTLNNAELKLAIDSTEIRLREGSSLSRALGSQGVFSPILIHLIRAGEASGKLGEMLKFAADNAELESEQKTKLFTGLLEPILILAMGLMVLGIVMSVMEPILEMNSGIR